MGAGIRQRKAPFEDDRMKVVEQPNELDRLWHTIPKLLEHDEGWALREVLNSSVAGYTREDDTPRGAADQA